MKLGWKIAISGVALLIFIIGFVIVYRLWLEFNNGDIEAYINQEAQKYGNPQATKTIIQDGVQDILLSSSLTKQAKDFARAQGLSNEQAIVTCAIAEAKAHGYLSN